MPTSSKTPAKTATKNKTNSDDLERALSTEPAESAKVDTIAGFKIEPVEAASKYVNVLVYGEAGVGKTVLAGSASTVEDMSPVLYLDIEGGTRSLLDFYPNTQTVHIKRWADLQKIYDELEKGNHPYKTVVVDSLTEAQKLAMRDLMNRVSGRDSTVDEDVPQMQQWLKNIEQTRRFARAMRDLPMNVILTALASKERDNRGKDQIRPLMNGKVAGELPGFYDLVLYMYMKPDGRDRKRMVLTNMTDTVQAKDRSNRLPLTIEDPSMEYIHGVITGVYGPSNKDSNTNPNDEEGTN